MKWVHIAIALLGVTLAYGDDGEAAAERQKRILAAYSTRTILSMTTTTLTSFFTCASAFTTDVCITGRKMRRYKSLLNDNVEDSSRVDRSLSDLSSSISEDFEDESDGSDREGRIALTVWSTTTTPYTWTSTSINSATTFSLSYWCSIVGQDFPPACG